MTADQEQTERGASTDRLSKIKERLSDALCSGIFYGIIGGYDDVDARDDVDWIIGALERVTAERDVMREVCEAAGMIAIREEYGTHRALRAALARLDATRNATDQ